MASLDDIVNATGGLDCWQAGQRVLGTLRFTDLRATSRDSSTAAR
ncbi:hypothetical protein [Mycolicibacterium brisbanense]|nr:hypothetical protein [Mycolicibacterium brisbanense]